jgi:Tfp pilus assembly ATPase PilU
MQTSTGRGMQTMEKSLAELVLRGVITIDVAVGASSRPDQLEGLLARAGVAVAREEADPTPAPPLSAGLRVAEA